MTVAADVVRLASGIVGGELPVRVRGWDGSEAGSLAVGAPVLVLRSPRALRHLLWSPGELGLARAYVLGDVDVEGDLDDGLRRMWTLAGSASRHRTGERGRVHLGWGDCVAAVTTAARLGAVGPPPRRPASEARRSHVGRGRLHSRARDRAVIAHHYDLSNEFYELVLDEHMAYSCAYFRSPGVTLAEAQRAKLELICDKLGLTPGMRLLDVGCGWGSLSLYAARVRASGSRGSPSRPSSATSSASASPTAGCSTSSTSSCSDYRDVAADGAFDAAASVEMGEHVGDEQYPEFLARLHGAVRRGGRVLIQQMSPHAGHAGWWAVHRGVHRPRHAHAAARRDRLPRGACRLRGVPRRGDA